MTNSMGAMIWKASGSNSSTSGSSGGSTELRLRNEIDQIRIRQFVHVLEVQNLYERIYSYGKRECERER